MLLEMCIVQPAEPKSVFNFEPKEILAFATVKGENSAPTSQIFLLGTKRKQLNCLMARVHLVLQKDKLRLEKVNLSPFLKNIIC